MTLTYFSWSSEHGGEGGWGEAWGGGGGGGGGGGRRLDDMAIISNNVIEIIMFTYKNVLWFQ